MKRKTKNPTDMSTLFKSTTGTLAQIKQKTNSLSVLSDIVRQTCPDLPEEVWNIANFSQNYLVIEVTSSIWSQRLQFERNKICQRLAQETNNMFTHIEIKVAPYRNVKVSNSAKKAPTHGKHLSQETANQLNEVAQNAPKGLKEKLERLAALANKR